MIEPIQWRDGILRFLDQTRLPNEAVTIETDDPAVVTGAIQILAIRGAPLLGIAGAYAAALSAWRNVGRPWELVLGQWDAIATARPTAVNLRWAVERMRRVVQPSGSVMRSQIEALVAEALRIHDEDRSSCERIARNGAPLLPVGSGVLTHCHTGALATGGIGTAFGVIRRAWEAGRVAHVYIDETRPLMQGARLTAWEAAELGIPATLLADSMAAILMRQGSVQAVIVGADRIARNGDTANKVGSYALAVLARAHGIPFYVAAPVSSIDRDAPTGADIPIEMRPGSEITQFGPLRVAPDEARTFNPAFDVTPGELIAAIVTDEGVAVPPFDLAGFPGPGTRGVA